MRKIGNPVCSSDKMMHLLMRAITTFFVLFVFTAACVADPFKAAVTDDADGFTYIRTEKSSDSAVVGKIKTGEVFYAEPSTDAWWRIKANEGRFGFMYRAYIRLIPASPTSDAPSDSVTPADIDSSADPADANAQDALGLKYLWGIGISVNEEKAAYWFSKAADQGHVAARATLGRQYFRGEGVAQDQKRGLGLMKEGLNKGNARAQANYGLCIANLWNASEGLSANNRKLLATGLFWMRKAAAQGGEYGARAAGAIRTIEEAYRADLREEAAVGLWNALFGGGSEESGEKTYGGFTDREIDAMAKAQKEIDAKNR